MSRLYLVAIVPVAALAMACSAGGAQDSSAKPDASPAAAQAQAPAPGGFTGTVVETMDAARYTYVKVDTGQGEIWAATTKFPVQKGDRVHVPDAPPMVNFHSDTLDRTFDKIYFVGAITKAGAEMPDGGPAAPAAAAERAAAPHTGAPELPAEVATAIEQPQGALSVAEIHAKRAALNGKQVTVRGKVVKVNMGIMGTNWYHLQDGTGSAADGTHDLAVTSNETATVGDVVTASGTLAADKDFGMGYKYEVILENATLTK